MIGVDPAITLVYRDEYQKKLWRSNKIQSQINSRMVGYKIRYFTITKYML